MNRIFGELSSLLCPYMDGWFGSHSALAFPIAWQWMRLRRGVTANAGSHNRGRAGAQPSIQMLNLLIPIILSKNFPMTTAWLYLILAGLCEIGWPLGLKISQTTSKTTLGIILAVVSMTISGTLLWLAQREISIGTAYAVWTGIGAAGTFIVGILFFRDPISALRLLSVAFIIGGVIGLKLAS